jgi:hypothetical protein
MKNLRILVFTVILTSVLTGCSVLYPNWGKPTETPTATNTQTQTPGPTPTVTETETPDPSKGVANVEIMDAYVDDANGVLQVVAQVTNFSEEGGTCTATFEGSGKKASVSVTAESNAANTQCRTMEIALGGLPKGTGQVIVTYDSVAHAGTSSPSSVTIQ